jgi:hypothetical protein
MKKPHLARLREAMAAAGLEPRPAVLEKGFNSHYFTEPDPYYSFPVTLREHREVAGSIGVKLIGVCPLLSPIIIILIGVCPLLLLFACGGGFCDCAQNDGGGARRGRKPWSVPYYSYYSCPYYYICSLLLHRARANPGRARTDNRGLWIWRRGAIHRARTNPRPHPGW